MRFRFHGTRRFHGISPAAVCSIDLNPFDEGGIFGEDEDGDSEGEWIGQIFDPGGHFIDPASGYDEKSEEAYKNAYNAWSGLSSFVPREGHDPVQLEFGDLKDVTPYGVNDPTLNPAYQQYIGRGPSEWAGAESALEGRDQSRYDAMGPSAYQGISSAHRTLGPSSFQGASSSFDTIGGSSFDDLYGSAFDKMGPNAFAQLEGESAFADLGDSAYADLEFDEGRMAEAEDYFSDLTTTGSDPIAAADLARRTREAENARRSQTEGALADAEMRGQGGGGSALLAELAANQGMASDLYQVGLDATAMSAARRDTAAERLGSLAERRGRGELDADSARAAGIDDWESAAASAMDDYGLTRAEGLESSGAVRAQGQDEFATTRAAGQDQFRTDKAAGRDDFRVNALAGQDEFRLTNATGLDTFATDRAAGMDDYSLEKAGGADDYTLAWAEGMDSFTGDRANAMDTRKDKDIDDAYKLQEANVRTMNEADADRVQRGRTVNDQNVDLWNDTQYFNQVTSPQQRFNNLTTITSGQTGQLNRQGDSYAEDAQRQQDRRDQQHQRNQQTAANIFTYGASSGWGSGGDKDEEEDDD